MFFFIQIEYNLKYQLRFLNIFHRSFFNSELCISVISIKSGIPTKTILGTFRYNIEKLKKKL